MASSNLTKNGTSPGTGTTADILMTERIYVSFVTISVSSFGILSNLMIFVLIWRYQNLRKNCKYLQALLAASDAVQCGGQFFNGTIYLVYVFTSVRLFRLTCLVLSAPGLFTIMYSLLITICIACDRCYAVCFPMKYRILPKARLCAVCGTLAFLIAFPLTVAPFTDVDLYDYPTLCPGSNSRSAAYNRMINYFGAIAGFAILVIYSIALIAMWYQKRQVIKMMNLGEHNGKADESTAQRMKRESFQKQVEATASITLVVMASLLLYALPNTTLLALSTLTDQSDGLRRAQMYIGLGLSVHCTINYFFYIWKDTRMRNSSQMFFRKLLKPNSVISLTNGTH